MLPILLFNLTELFFLFELLFNKLFLTYVIFSPYNFFGDLFSILRFNDLSSNCFILLDIIPFLGSYKLICLNFVDFGMI